MTPNQDQPIQAERSDREKSWVALTSVGAAISLTVMKLVVGVATGSLGILSEAAHSGLDLVAAVITYFAVKSSSRPADREHTYGHAKIENLSALFETLLLLGTCVWIFVEAIKRLFSDESHIEVSLWAFVIMLVSIAVDISRSRALARAAKKYNSQALEADALHFRTDIWSSLVVLFGLGLVWTGGRTGWSWLYKADPIAALGVAGIVVVISIRLGRRTIADLLDEVQPRLREEVSSALHNLYGAKEVGRVRLRKSGPEAFVDVNLVVDAKSTVEESHQIAESAEEAVQKIIPGADVVVHIDPAHIQERQAFCQKVDFVELVRQVARRFSLGVHDIRIRDIWEEKTLEVHLEVSNGLNLEMAHERASIFERAVKKEYPQLHKIVTHIEPTSVGVPQWSNDSQQEKEIAFLIQKIAFTMDSFCDPHDIQITREGDELDLSLHCVLDAKTEINTAHNFSEKLETQLRIEIPALRRVVIHVEPK